MTRETNAGQAAVSTADNPFYHGVIRSEVRFHGGCSNIEEVLLPDEAVNGQRADHVLGGVVASIRMAIDELNQYVNDHCSPTGTTNVVVERTTEHDGKSLSVRLVFDLKVDVPEEMLKNLGDALVDGWEGCMTHRLSRSGRSPFPGYGGDMSLAFLRQFLGGELAVLELSDLLRPDTSGAADPAAADGRPEENPPQPSPYV